jgi:hypothetical protein
MLSELTVVCSSHSPVLSAHTPISHQLIYTTFMSYPALAAIRASYTYLQSGETEAVSLLISVMLPTLD